MSWTNFHSHSHYCDGKYAPEAHVQAALAKQMPAFGFSSHAPVRLKSSWPMKLNRLSDYLAETRQLKEEYKNEIQLYVGLEMDYIPGIISRETDYIQTAELDYIIGSIHFVDQFEDGKHWEIDNTHQVFLKGLNEIFDNNIQAAVSRYFELTREMVEACPGIIVGHMDKIKMQNRKGELFSENSDWYRNEVLQTLDLIQEKNLIIEVNTRGLYKKKTSSSYPSSWILSEIHKRQIPIMLNSDSHHINELTSYFPETAKLLLDIGFTKLMALWNGAWQPFSFNEKGLVF